MDPPLISEYELQSVDKIPEFKVVVCRNSPPPERTRVDTPPDRSQEYFFLDRDTLNECVLVEKSQESVSTHHRNGGTSKLQVPIVLREGNE